MSKMVRHQIKLDEMLSRRLDLIAGGPGGSKSAVVADALNAMFQGQGGSEIDTMLRIRLDRVNAGLRRIERDLQITLETLGLFIRYQLSVIPPVPEADQPMAHALGQHRFRSFIDQVGQRLAAGKPFTRELHMLMPEAAASSPASADPPQEPQPDGPPLGAEGAQPEASPAGQEGAAGDTAGACAAAPAGEVQP